MTPTLIRLSEREFARVRAVSRLHPTTLQLVHAVLVDGRRQVDVAADIGKSRAWVQQAVAKFLADRNALEDAALPAGWTRRTIALPKDLWPAVRKVELEARNRIKLRVDSRSQPRGKTS